MAHQVGAVPTVYRLSRAPLKQHAHQQVKTNLAILPSIARFSNGQISMTAQDSPSPDIEKLRQLVKRLRAPDGCPWDREQTIDDLRAYLIEEAHEAAAAISGGDRGDLREELGDLLFQIVFTARLGEEEGTFDLAGVIDGVHAKMVERHPHVFGDESLADADAVRRRWEERKVETAEAGGGPRRSLLAGVPRSLPALVGAYRLGQKAAGVGFDWPKIAPVLAKVREELAELEDSLEDEAAAEEVGDLLFSVANLARHLGIDPEAALAATNEKFRRRFAAVEDGLERRGKTLVEADLDEMDELWNNAKNRESQEPKR